MPAAVGPNYTGFTLSPFGQLRPLADSTVSLPNGSQPGDVLFNSTGTNLVGTRVGTSLIDSFAVGRNGLLTEAPGAPFTAQGLGPFGSEFRPTNPQQLFVSNAHNVAPLSGTISAFNVAFNGSLILPVDPDASADRLRRSLEDASGARLGVVVADTHGRPFRRGNVGVAIGVSGIVALVDQRGHSDLYGRTLQATIVPMADQLAGAAALIGGEAAEGLPVVIAAGGTGDPG